MLRTEIIAEAKEWIGTPWVHQARRKGLGADCVGFVTGVYKELGGVAGCEIPADYPATWHVWNKEERLYETAKKVGLVEKPIEKMKAGDVVFFRFGNMPASHLGILIEDDLFLHSYMTFKKIMPTKLDKAWRRRIAYVMEFQGVVD